MKSTSPGCLLGKGCTTAIRTMTTTQNAPNALVGQLSKIMPLKSGRQPHLDPMSLDRKYSNIMYSPANRPHDMISP